MTTYPDLPAKIPFEGPDSKNPLAFKHYERDAVVLGRPMKDWLRFGAAYWHCMRNPLHDPFGVGTAQFPWDDGSDSVENAQNRARVFFDFLDKIGIDFYCFHDRDIAPEADSLAQTNKNLDAVADTFEELQKAHGKTLLWGTACLFAHPRYHSGAATSPDARVYAYAGAQVKKAMEVTHRLGGLGYTFWGGREGYGSLINSDMPAELDRLARFLHLAVDFKKQIGFTGQFYIEPKPQEPTTHQYDYDAATCLYFLKHYDLWEHFQLNLETNHVTLAGHTMGHDLVTAASVGKLGSLDANQGTPNVGWDTDQFPSDIYLTTQIAATIIDMGGFKTGGLNFDAKRRRESYEPVDLAYAHIGGMDAFARGLKIAATIKEDGSFEQMLKERYATWQDDLGKKIDAGQASLADLEQWALNNPDPIPASGRQERFENLLNDYIR
ncbi:MAG: xylose isomerase [Opitutales bacterium]